MVKRGKKGHSAMTEGSSHQENRTIVSIPNNGATKYVKQIYIKLKEKINMNAVIV